MTKCKYRKRNGRNSVSIIKIVDNYAVALNLFAVNASDKSRQLFIHEGNLAHCLEIYNTYRLIGYDRGLREDEQA